MNQHSLYHSALRIAALTLAITLLFTSGIVSSYTKNITYHTEEYLANVIGMQASVLPNEINTLSAQLEQKSRELKEREIAVALKEQSATTVDTTTFVLSIILFILTLLITLNYVFDFIRAHREKVKKLEEQTA
jgi:predicted PurR-regulated permease PerM